MSNNKRLDSLRQYMRKENTDICLLYSTDYHNSEYISDYYKFRNYISGFTGSAATMLITYDEAYLWTDGRYFIQAEEQLMDSGITLCKSGEKDVLEPEDFLQIIIQEGQTIGIDARTVTADNGCLLNNIVKNANGELKCDFCPADFIWADRPEFPVKKISILEEKYCGKSASDKLYELRNELSLKENEAYILCSLDDIAWVLNLRGGDVTYNPVFYSYLYIDNSETVLFANANSFDEEIISYLNSLDIRLDDYNNILNCIGNNINIVLCDCSSTNYAVYSYIKNKAEIKNIINPTIIKKAIKNKTECINLKYCNELDGAAVVRFMMWIEEAIKKDKITEFMAAAKLDSIRTKHTDCFEPSFDTICGYGANGAIIHYSASEDNSAIIKPEASLLVDSGGQYLYGTTDITRTFALGQVSAEYKKDFTLVLKSMLALQNLKFLKGSKGSSLDIIARQPLWNELKNYNHGTGHGIGYFLNVHEGPIRISWNLKTNNDTELIPGMIVSDEPGIYIKNKYGIRIENMLLCKELEENEYGTFLCFEPLTYAPIDLNSIETSLLNETDKKHLNDYHKLVYDKLSKYLNELECNWLKERTKAV